MAAEGIAILGIMALVMLVIAVAVLSFVFWIWMVIDCAQRKFKSENDKVVWILVIVLAGIIGAAIYYFVVKRKS